MYLTIYNETLPFFLKVVAKLVIPANTSGVLIPQKIIIKPKWKQKWRRVSTSSSMSFRILYGFWWQTRMTLLWWLTRYLHGNSNIVVLHELYLCRREQDVRKERYMWISIETNWFYYLAHYQEEFLLPLCFLCTTQDLKRKNYFTRLTCIFRLISWVEVNRVYFLKLFYS